MFHPFQSIQSRWEHRLKAHRYREMARQCDAGKYFDEFGGNLAEELWRKFCAPSPSRADVEFQPHEIGRTWQQLAAYLKAAELAGTLGAARTSRSPVIERARRARRSRIAHTKA